MSKPEDPDNGGFEGEGGRLGATGSLRQRAGLLIRATLGVLFTTLGAVPAQAFWYGETVKKGSDIMMMDLRWPFWSESTYYANWNSGVEGFSFYGGYNSVPAAVPPDFLPDMNTELQDGIRPGSIWTFWGENPETNEPVRTLATSRYNYLYQYVGEGASAAFYGSAWPIERNKWYTMLIRMWKPVGPDAENYRYIGRWTKDVEAGHWYLFGIAKIPTTSDAGFVGNAGFLEDFGNGCRSIRSIHRRLGYCREGGGWHSTHLGVTLKERRREEPFPWAYVPQFMDDDSVIAIENTGRIAKLPFQHQGGKVAEFGKDHTYVVKQSDQPALDELIVEDLRAESNGSQVMVTWTVPPSSAPQLHYKVEIFDNPECTGAPLAMEEESLPHVRQALVSVRVDRPTVRLTVTDIFDNQTKSVTVKAELLPAPAPVASAEGMAPGLHYEYLTKDDDRQVNVLWPAGGKTVESRNERHYWTSLDELKQGKLIQQGVSNGFDTAFRGNRKHGYGFRYNGFLKVPETGLYLFTLRGTDGYRMRIDEQTALEWDGLHGPEDRFFYLHLAKGFHPVSLDYFLDQRPPFLEIQWEGPGFEKQVISAEALYHRADPAAPEIAFSVANASRDDTTLAVKNGQVISTVTDAAGEPEQPGMVTIALDIDAKGQTLEKIELYHNTVNIASLSGKAATANATVRSVLPRGPAEVWLRLHYGDHRTIDSPRIPVDVQSPALEGWQLKSTGEKELPFNAVQTAPDAFSFVGEGDYTLTRPVTGDFTLSAKIESFMSSADHPINPSAWIGIRSIGPHSDHGIYQWADGTIRTSPDYPDVVGQRCGQGLYQNGPWLRIVRAGTLWSTFTSKDGKTWKPANSFVTPQQDAVNVGIMFSALPQDRLTYFSAAISNLRIEPGVPRDSKIESKVAEGTADLAVTGLAVAPSNPEVVVVRTPKRGLFRSTDKGKTWASANGALTGASNAVRSVAIHPANPNIMIRAAGSRDDVGHFQGGLFKTTDGGRTWVKLVFEGDFDGRGPSAICGEVVAFNHGAPNEILAGTETKGLFRSTDGGQTWSRVLPGDQRFAAVKFNRFLRGTKPEVYAVTCHDAVMPILGRGLSRFETTDPESHIYRSGDGGASFVLKSGSSGRGFLNLALFNIPTSTELMLGTTHGFEYSYNSGVTTFLFSGHPSLEHLRPITAIASSMDENNDGLYSRSLMQAINPAKVKRMSLGGHHWFWPAPTTIKAPFTGVVKIEAADLGKKASGKDWWFLGLDGLYLTTDRCGTFTEVLVNRE